jgi:hypothetical protein
VTTPIKDDSWPLQDHKAILETIKAIVANADELTEFEGDFLQELARCATKFREKLRMSPKQLEILDGLENQFVLGARIKAKMKVKDPKAKELIKEIFKT